MRDRDHEPRPDPPASEFRRRGRIVYWLLAVLVFVGLAPLATVAWKLIDINREALTTAQQEYQLLLASSIANELDIHVEGLRLPVQRVAQTLGAAIQREGGSEPIARILGDVADERMPYLRYTYFRADDSATLSTGSLPDALAPVFAEGFRRAAESLADRDERGFPRAVLSDPVLIEEGPARAVVVVSAPVVSRGTFRGVLSAMVDLQSVWTSIVERNRTGHVLFALDRRGRAFASNSAAHVRPGADLRQSALTQRFLFGEGRARETMPFHETRDGVEESFLGSYAVTQHGWGVFVEARQEEVYLPVRRMVESTSTWALAALAIAILAAIVFADTLSRPAKRLAEASRTFAAGDFSARVEVRSRNEIGELAHTFNRMAAQIETHIRRLHQAAEENKELFLGTIRALAQAIDAKDPYTRGHSVRVNRYSVILARQLGLSEEQVREIHVASLMHDVGKIGIHDRVLQKPGKLTDEEFEIMKRHTVLGANIMSQIRRMKSMIPGLRSHHERWNGQGYPDGLAGEQIPLMARIIAVADAFDAMTTHRPYQQAMTFPQALQRLNDLKSVAFEDRMVEAFNRAYHQGLIQPQQAPADEPAEAARATA